MEPPQPHQILKIPKPTFGVEVLMTTGRQVIGRDAGVGVVVVEGVIREEVRAKTKIRSTNPIVSATIIIVV